MTLSLTGAHHAIVIKVGQNIAKVIAMKLASFGLVKPWTAKIMPFCSFFVIGSYISELTALIFCEVCD
jgi:hypothetical protein